MMQAAQGGEPTPSSTATDQSAGLYRAVRSNGHGCSPIWQPHKWKFQAYSLIGLQLALPLSLFRSIDAPTATALPVWTVPG